MFSIHEVCDIYKCKVMKLFFSFHFTFSKWNPPFAIIILHHNEIQALIVTIRCQLRFIFLILFFISTGFPFYLVLSLMLLDVLVQFVFGAACYCSRLNPSPLLCIIYLPEQSESYSEKAKPWPMCYVPCAMCEICDLTNDAFFY